MPTGVYTRTKPSYWLGRKHTEEAKKKMSIFLTGKVSRMKGKHHTEEAKRKIGLASKGNTYNLGKKVNEEVKQKIKDALKLRFPNGRIPWNKGQKGVIKQSEETKIKRGIYIKGEKHHSFGISKVPWNKGIKTGHTPWNKGKKFLQISGANNVNWKGGITPINKAIRESLESKLWRKEVFEKDNYQCVWGGKAHGSKLEADHIKPFRDYPELRFVVSNGRTLCKDCHRKTDTWGRSKNYKVVE